MSDTGNATEEIISAALQRGQWAQIINILMEVNLPLRVSLPLVQALSAQTQIQPVQQGTRLNGGDGAVPYVQG